MRSTTVIVSLLATWLLASGCSTTTRVARMQRPASTPHAALVLPGGAEVQRWEAWEQSRNDDYLAVRPSAPHPGWAEVYVEDHLRTTASGQVRDHSVIILRGVQSR